MSDPTRSPEDPPGPGWSRHTKSLKQLLTELFGSRSEQAGRLPCLPYTSSETSRSRADQRRAALRSVLANVGDAGYLRREFLEIPPGFGNVEQISFADNLAEGYGQMARLRWQLDGDELLLIERLVDAIVILLRQQADRYQSPSEPESPEDYPLVKLESIEVGSEEANLFPWKAVIETDNPAFYVEMLTPIREWLGIGVDLAPRRRVRLLGLCKEAGGLEGVVGGLVEDEQQYAMTCAHVLAPGCGSVTIRGNPYRNVTQLNNEPDAALIDIGTPCFMVPQGNKKKTFSCATDQIILNSANSQVKVFKLNPSPQNDPGVVYNQVVLLPATNRGPAYRFPHIEIRSHRMEYLYGYLKLGKRYFSREGDSGSWVIERATGIWFGMIIAGNDEGVTYAAEGRPLLDYFEQQLKNLRNSGTVSKLLPFTLS